MNPEKSNPGLFICNSKGNLLQISQVMYTLSGYPLHTMLQEPFTDLFTPDDHQKLVENTENMLLTGKEFTLPSTLKGLQQNTPVMVTATTAESLIFVSVTLTTPEIEGTLFDKKNEEERKLANQEKELEKSNQEDLINSTNDLIWSFDKNHLLITANKAFKDRIRKLTGIEIKPGDCLLLQEYFPESFVSLWGSLYKKALNGERLIEEIFTPEFEGISESWSVTTLNPIYQNERVVGVSCYSRDITDNKYIQVQLQQSKEQLEIAQQIAKLGLWEMELKTNNISFSKEALVVLGIEAADFKGSFEFFQSLIHREDRENFLTAFEQSLIGETLLNIEHRIVTENGLVKTLVQKGYLIYDSNNEPLRFQATIQDITERKYMEESLFKNQRQLDLIYNTVNEAIFLINIEEGNRFRFESANQTFLRMYGLSKEQVIHRFVEEVFSEATAKKVIDKYNRCVNTFKTLSWEETIEYSGGTKIGKVNVKPLLNEVGVCVQLIGSIHDITDIKEAAIQLEQSNERYDMVAKATNDYIWDWNLKTNEVTRIGNGLKVLFGYDHSDENSLVKFWDALIHPDDLERIKLHQKNTFFNTQENNWEAEYRFLKSDGAYAYVYDKGYIIRNDKGKPLRMIGATQDISLQKEQTNEIIRIKQNLDSLINTTGDRIWSISNNYQIIASNSANENYLFNKTGALLHEGDLMIGLNDPDEKTVEEKSYYDRALKGERFNIEYAEFCAEYEDCRYSIISFSPILNSLHQISGVACHAKDITDLKKTGEKLSQLNKELLEQAEELEESNAALERFACVASHDLQEPLRMVGSFLQLLEKKYKDKIDETSTKYIHYAVDGADRMKKLILDLLEYSRIGTTKDLITSVDMNEVAKDVLQIMDATIVELPCKIMSTELPVLKAASRTQMFQLLQNLISNALKYHGEPPCEIFIEAIEQKDNWLFKLKDNGIGFDPEFAERVFVIFQRLHNKSEYNGTGIGLSICKKIVELHGGNIWVESEMGKGSTFYFTISK